MDIEQLGYRIIGCALEAHRSLGGCGLLESIYEDAFCFELENSGLAYQRQQVVPVVYKTTTLPTALRIDLSIENQILVECKATIDYNAVFESQLLTYLRLSKYRLGFVINYGEAVLKNGFTES